MSVLQRPPRTSFLERSLLALIAGGTISASVPAWSTGPRIEALEVQVRELNVRVAELSGTVRALTTQLTLKGTP